jgi:putative glutamine amidotransferase
MRSPMIGMTANTARLNTFDSQSRDVTVIGNLYIDPIVEVGGAPLLISALLPAERAPELVSRIDGLILTGGQDLHAQTYGQEPKVRYAKDVEAFGVPYLRPLMMAPDQRRDTLELALYRAAKQRGIPVLGLCRGMQLINVAEGGTLFQEIDGVASLVHELDTEGYIHHHMVEIREGTVVHQTLQERIYMTPSTHHQAVDKLGENLVVSGVAEDGIIEFIESSEAGRFIVGLQGHVERARLSLPKFRGIFRRFIDESRAAMPRSESPDGRSPA